MTVIMQSSSAAVATTMTALHAGAVNFEQAASLVIGAAIGTTVTGVLAAIGGSVPAKRTALAHVLFNLSAGLIAVLMLPVFLWGIRLAHVHLGLDAGTTSLAAFHALFSAVGVAVFLPLVHPFSRWIERLLPERGPALTRPLDATLLQVPTVALEVTRRTLSEAAGQAFSALRACSGGPPSDGEDLRRVLLREALDQTQRFFAQIPPVAENAPLSQSRLTQMHAIDHLARLLSRLQPPARVRRMLAHERLQTAVARCQSLLELGEEGLQGRGPADWLAGVEQQALALAELCRAERAAVLGQTSQWRLGAGPGTGGVGYAALARPRGLPRLAHLSPLRRRRQTGAGTGGSGLRVANPVRSTIDFCHTNTPNLQKNRRTLMQWSFRIGKLFGIDVYITSRSCCCPASSA